MIYEDFINEMVNRNALIVHCSRPGKGDTNGEKLFPEDMKDAIDILSNTENAISCSVVWPGHNKAFGDVGIIIKPKNIESIVMVNSSDAGTWYNKHTGERECPDNPLSIESMLDTFQNSKDYNEWVLKNSDTIGIYVRKSDTPLEVACKCKLQHNNETIVSKLIKIEEIKEIFNGLPIYTLTNNEIIDVDGFSTSPYKK